MTQKQSWRRLVGITACVLGLVAPLAADSRGQDKPAQRDDRGIGKQLSDGWITMKIHGQFIGEDALDGSDIDVDTVNGVVTLTGTVTTEAGRARAVALAKSTDGVKTVSDKLRIAKDTDTQAAAREAGRETGAAARQGGRRVNDGWIKSKIYSQFLTEDSLEDSDIDLTVKGGVVTLNGRVTTAAARSRAVAVAKATDGVKDVKDSLKVSKQ